MLDANAWKKRSQSNVGVAGEEKKTVTNLIRVTTNN